MLDSSNVCAAPLSCTYLELQVWLHRRSREEPDRRASRPSERHDRLDEREHHRSSKDGLDRHGEKRPHREDRYAEKVSTLVLAVRGTMSALQSDVGEIMKAKVMSGHSNCEVKPALNYLAQVLMCNKCMLTVGVCACIQLILRKSWCL